MIPGGDAKSQNTPLLVSLARVFIFILPVLMRAWPGHSENKNPFLTEGEYFGFAERGGFEPPVHRLADNGFRDRRIRPLCHLSFFPDHQEVTPSGFLAFPGSTEFLVPG